MKKISVPNARTYKKDKINGGATYKNGKKVQYKSGYQVSIKDITTVTELSKIHKIAKELNGNFGLWWNGDTCYIDISIRVSTKKEAIRIAKEYNQLAILRWSDMTDIEIK